MRLTRRYICFSLILVGAFLSLNAATDRHIKIQINELESVPQDHIRFIVLPDRAGGAREEAFKEAVQAISKLSPDFVVTVGDQISGYTEDLAELRRQWDAYLADIDELEFPFVITAGNHDNLLPKQKELWSEIMGPNYYHYRIGGFLFLHLDSQDNPVGGPYLTGIGDTQFEYMKKALENNTDASWTFVFLHQPVWSVLENVRMLKEGGTKISARHHSDNIVDNGNWSKLEAMLSQRQHTVFAGHEHFYRYEKRNGNEYYTLATAGGDSPLNGVRDGTFDHLMLVSAETGNDPVFANVLLDGIIPNDIISTEDGIALATLEQVIPAPVLDPVLMDPSQDYSTVIRLELPNPSPYPLQYEVNCVNLGGLSIGKSQFTGTISSEGEEVIEIPVWRRAKDSVPDNSGVRLTINYLVPLHGQVCFRKTYVRDGILLIPGPGNILGLNSQPDHGVELLMDADLSTYWASMGKNARFIYVLPEEREISSINLAFFSGDKRQAHFEILGSCNLVDWECLFEGSSSGKTDGFQEFPFSKPATVRYLSFVGHGNSVNLWNSVLEMDLEN